MATLLVIDDDRSVLQLVSRAFEGTSINVVTSLDARHGEELLRQGVDVALLDIMLPDISGLDLARRIRVMDARLPVIFITARGTSDMAIEAMKLGAYDYLLKPLNLPYLRELVDRALEIRRLMLVPVTVDRAPSIPPDGDQIIGRSPAMQEVFKSIGRVAPQTVTVLIHGESGTGKELVARAIYHHSLRGQGCFLAVNCAAIPETLLESELFGHERGSFTGADHRRIGKFEQCTGGTIFLDEVGDMSPFVQSKVLRVLQEQRFERVGGTETIQTDVRLIAATNRDLKQMVASGEFREDLYYRLNGFTINLPPLRERGEDVLLLLEHSLRRFNRELEKDVHSFSPAALRLLQRYDWPGNVRELEAVVRQTLLQTTGNVVLPEFLPPPLTEESRSHKEDIKRTPDLQLEAFVEECLHNETDGIHSRAIDLLERYLITRVLRHTGGNQSHAAKLLGITRGNLRNKIRTLRISLGTKISIEEDSGVFSSLEDAHVPANGQPAT